MNQITKAKRGRPATNNTPTGQVQSLYRGLVLLEKIADATTGVLLSDLASLVGLPASTTHRLLNTLEQQGFVRQESQDLWHIGTTGFKVGNAFLASRDFVRQAKPFLVELVESAGETSNLSILEGGKAVIIAQEQCNEMMRMMVPLGSRSPLHASGVGKAILAYLPQAEQQQQLDELELEKITQWTITDKIALKEALAQTKEQGWAYDDQEHAVGLRCISSCIFNEQALPMAAISVSGPLARISDDRAKELGDKVCLTAKKITEYIGGRWPSSLN